MTNVIVPHHQATDDETEDLLQQAVNNLDDLESEVSEIIPPVRMLL